MKILSSKTANSFMLFLLLYSLLFRMVLTLVVMLFPENVAWLLSPWANIPFQIMIFIVPIAIFMRAADTGARGGLRVSISNHYRRRRLDAANVVMVLGMCLFLQPAMMLVAFIMNFSVQNPVTGLMEQLVAMPFLAALLIIAVTPAICEEWTFRGFIQSHYHNVPLREAALVNGLFFGIIHLSLHQLPYAFFMGVLFYYIVYYTRSFFAGVWAHFIVNATQFSLAYFTLQSEETAAAAAAVDLEQLTAVPLLGEVPYVMVSMFGFLLFMNLLFLPFFFILFTIFKSHNRKRNITWDLQHSLPALALPEDAPEAVEVSGVPGQPEPPGSPSQSEPPGSPSRPDPPEVPEPPEPPDMPKKWQSFDLSFGVVLGLYVLVVLMVY